MCRNLFFGYYINFHCGWIIIIIKLDCESNIIDGSCEPKKNSKQIRAFVCTQTAFRFYFHRICFFVSFGYSGVATSLCLFQFNERQRIRAYIFHEVSHTKSHKISKSKSHKISKESNKNGNEIISFVIKKKMLCLFRFRRLIILLCWKLVASIFSFSRPFSSIIRILCKDRDKNILRRWNKKMENTFLFVIEETIEWTSKKRIHLHWSQLFFFLHITLMISNNRGQLDCLHTT